MFPARRKNLVKIKGGLNTGLKFAFTGYTEAKAAHLRQTSSLMIYDKDEEKDLVYPVLKA